MVNFILLVFKYVLAYSSLVIALNKIRIGGDFIPLISHKYVAHKKQKLLKIEN